MELTNWMFKGSASFINVSPTINHRERIMRKNRWERDRLRFNDCFYVIFIIMDEGPSFNKFIMLESYVKRSVWCIILMNININIKTIT